MNENIKILTRLCRNNFLFWASRIIDYPLIAPDIVQVNFSFRCNLACSMCSMREQMKFLQSQGRRTEIDSDTFRKIIKETQELGTKSILFIGGEPLLRSDLFELIGYARDLGLNTVIVTNAVLLDEEKARKCIEAGVSWLSISIDAASEGIFNKIRGKDILQKIVNNIKTLNRLKEEKGVEFAKIGVVCTIMNDNLEELLDVAHLTKRLKAEKIIFQPVVTNNADQSCRDPDSSIFIDPSRFHILDGAIDSLAAYKKSSPENFNFISNSLGHLKLIKKYLKSPLKSNRWPCYAGYNRLQIAQDYRIYFCIPPNKTVDASFGDVSGESLKKMWYSQEAKVRRKLIKTCNIPCLQWCSYRDDFTVLSEIFQKAFLFRLKKVRRK
ncbi:MAG: radical SAM protein [Candidatus Omnitrophica bacterium]|nr:radical SAM protein [Candidatus Omnitrophota bacterium]